MTEIAMINASFPSSKAYVPVGTLLVTAVLEKAGYSVKFMDYQMEKVDHVVNPHYFAAYLKRSQANYIGISVFANSLPTVLLGVQKFKTENPHIKIVLGGPAVSDCAEQIMELAPIDVIVRGEGEITGLEVFSHLINNKPLDGIPGITFYSEEQIRSNPDQNIIKNLEQYPFPAYHHIDFKNYNYEATIFASRGCPYKCTFCAKPIWKQSVTCRSVEHVIKEMKLIYDQVEQFNFCDDAFVADRSRLLEFCAKFQDYGLTKPWECTGRIGRMDDEILQQIQQAGCNTLFLGVESGSERVLKHMNKQFTPATARHEINLSKKYINKVYTSYIWGLPFEKMDDFYETLFFIGEDLEDKVIKPVFTLATPLLSTQLYNENKDKLCYLDNNHYVGVTLPLNHNLSDYPDVKEFVLQYPDIFSGFYYLAHPEFNQKRVVIDKIRRIRN